MWKRAEPHAVVHYYWGQAKPKFIRESDTYAHWVMLAPEEGEFQYAVGQEHGQVSFGQVVLCPPGMKLHRKIISPTLSFHFIEFKWNDSDGAAGAKSSAIPCGGVTITDKQRLLSNYDYLKRSSLDKDLSAHYVLDLVHLCLDSVRVEVAPKPIDGIIQKVAAYIEEHAAEPMRMEDIAHLHGLSPSQLTRRFHAAYQKGPLQYLTSVRMHNIKEMLINSDYTIDTIAQLNGYQNGFYMSRVFAQQTNMTPSKFRMTHRV